MDMGFLWVVPSSLPPYAGRRLQGKIFTNEISKYLALCKEKLILQDILTNGKSKKIVDWSQYNYLVNFILKTERHKKSVFNIND